MSELSVEELERNRQPGCVCYVVHNLNSRKDEAQISNECPIHFAKFPTAQEGESEPREIQQCYFSPDGKHQTPEQLICIHCGEYANPEPQDEPKRPEGIHLPWILDEGGQDISYIEDAQDVQVAEGEPAAIAYIMQLVKAANHE